MTMSDNLQSPDLILGQEFLTWLWYRSDTSPCSFRTQEGEQFSVYMEQRIVVQGGEGEKRETATVTGALSPLREARFGLGTGKKVSRALIRLERDELIFQFTLKAEDFGIGGLKTPRLDASDKDDEPDALFLEKIFLIEICLKLLDTLYYDFLKLRLSSKWSEEVREMGQWLSRTE